MNPRERMLAIGIGSLAAILALWFLSQNIEGRFRTRRNTIADVEAEIAKHRLTTMQSTIALRRRNEYEARSLPSQAALARSLYQHWLLERVRESGFDRPLVSAVSSREENKTQTRHQFNISGTARLDEVVRLLYEIQSVDTLHRISRVSIRPIRESKELDIQLTVEALALRTAPPDGKLPLAKSDRLAGTTLADFLTPIEERNLFGPPNNAPKLGTTSERAQTNKATDFSLKGSDPDLLDKVTYRLVKSPEPDAKIDPETGRFRWTPRTAGQYEFIVEVVDDGIPARRVQQAMTVAVADPPPPEPVKPPEPKKLAFDAAKFTVLTGIVEVDGEGEVWLLIRPEGRTLKLHAGDEFEIGSVVGVVSAISSDSFTFEAAGRMRKLDRGGVLEDADLETATSIERGGRDSSAN